MKDANSEKIHENTTILMERIIRLFDTGSNVIMIQWELEAETGWPPLNFNSVNLRDTEK